MVIDGCVINETCVLFFQPHRADVGMARGRRGFRGTDQSTWSGMSTELQNWDNQSWGKRSLTQSWSLVSFIFSLSMFFNTFCGAVALLRGGGECSTKNQPFLGNVPSHGPASRDHGAQNFSESVSLPRKLKRTLRNETHTHRSTASYFVRENFFWSTEEI